jgi:hypothetical protein
VVAIPTKRTVGDPALDNQIVGFVKALTRVGRFYFIRKIFHTGADDHARDHSALGNDAEHGDLFRHPLRMIVKRQNIA